MTKPIEFNDFYRMLNKAKGGIAKDEVELARLIKQYRSPKDSLGAYDEIGKIFCSIGITELYTYTGLTSIRSISQLSLEIWDYLKLRMDSEITDFTSGKMIYFAKEDGLIKKVANTWKVSEEDLDRNIDGLASYIAEGIVEIIR